MKPGSKHLILPVETAARELDAKLLIALHAVQRGIHVTLGNKALLNLAIHTLEPGIYVSHNFNAGRNRIIGIARQLGHRVVAWDEEGIVWLNPESYRARRVSADAVKNLDELYVWGHEQQAALAPALHGMAAKIKLTGNPRADLLRPELRNLYQPRADALKQEHGDFILINSNFGWINHALAHGSGKNGAIDLSAIAIKSNFPLGYLQHRFAIYQEFVRFLPEIARRFAQRKIIIRPHPSENPAGWQEAAHGLSNVMVHYDGELVPWLMSASHIIHNGCTTAIETALLDRIAISFRPVHHAEYEIPQPHRVSLEAKDTASLMEMLATSGFTDNPPADRRAALENMIVSATGPLSSHRIAEAVNELFEKSGSLPPLWRRLQGHATARARRLEKYFSQFNSSAASNPAYYSHKFPPFTTQQITQRMKILADQLNLRVPVIQEVSDRIFQIRAA